MFTFPKKPHQVVVPLLVVVAVAIEGRKRKVSN
jgi:hypothetical protein